MADRDLARQAIEQMSEDLLDLGFEGPFKTVMAENSLSASVRDADDNQKILRVRNYLKGLIKELQTSKNANAKQAVNRIARAWEEFKNALTDDFGDDDNKPTHVPQRGAGAIAARRA